MGDVNRQQAEHQRTTAAKATKTVERVRDMVKSMNQEAARAKSEGRPVAYCMVGSMYDEIIRAMGIVPVWTENYAGLCAAKRNAAPYLEAAESDGYSNLICGYLRTGLGFDSVRHKLGCTPPGAPDGGMPKPDLLLGSSYLCDPRYKWYQALGRYMSVPTYSYDVAIPPVDAQLNEARDYYVAYQTDQLRGLAAFLESRLKKQLSYDLLWEIIKIGEETGSWWRRTCELRKAIPSPLPSQDYFNCMVPGYFMLGTKEALTFYRDLFLEVKDRAQNKASHVAEEKYRLIWAGGGPPWHTMWIINYFESMGAVLVVESTYRPPEQVEVPSSIKDPLEYIAHREFLRRTLRYEKARSNSGDPDVELLRELIDAHAIGGMVCHASRSCRVSTIGQLHWKNLVQRYVRIPFLQLTSDLVDLRDYSESDWKTKIDAFMDTLTAGTGKSRIG